MVSARPTAAAAVLPAAAVGAAATATKRPRNRKQLILDAGGRIFNERGYHATSMEEIAASVGITAAALYRHFPSKYDLFVDCVNLLADRLLGVVAAQDSEVGLEQLLREITAITVDHRSIGGIYRWEARYLDGPNRRRLRTKFARVIDSVAAEIRAEVRPGRSAAPGWERLRAAAALGAIGSITMHRTTLARHRLDQTLLAAALRVAASPAGRRHRPGHAAPPVAPPAPPDRRAQILTAAIALFDREGYNNATMGAIAQTLGLAPSALYRHYPSKAHILSAACLQAAALLEDAVQFSLAPVENPGTVARSTEQACQSLRALAGAYVAYSFEHRSLTSVAGAELVGLPLELKRPLIAAQQAHIAVWRDRLQAARPDLDARQVKVLVHAGFGVVVEAGRWLHWADSPQHRALIAALLLGALGVEP